MKTGEMLFITANEKDEVKREGGNSISILVVDDEPFNLVALEGLLGHLNIDKIDKALNGRDALDIIKKNTIAYDMVITDN
jgi:CheY-like chemotaxis protein